MHIFVSRLKHRCDYSDLLQGIISPDDNITFHCNKVSIDCKYSHNNKEIVIKGKSLLRCINGFDQYFMAPDDIFEQDTNREKNMVNDLDNIIKKIISECGMKSSDKESNYLFIHWGGERRGIYSTRLKNATEQVNDFRFKIKDFSSTDTIYSTFIGNDGI